MIARFETGEVLLTTSIREVFKRVSYHEVARDAALGKFACKSKLVEVRHTRRLTEAQPAFGKIAAGQSICICRSRSPGPKGRARGVCSSTSSVIDMRVR